MPELKSNFLDISDSMKKSLEEMKKHIATFYSQEDFLNKLDEVYKRRDWSDFPSLKNELCYMFEARSFPNDAIQKLSAADKNNFNYNYFKNLIINTVPTKKKLIVSLLKEIHKIYKAFPPQEKFLARIVKRLAKGDKDFSDKDSMQMQVLKRFVRHTDYHTEVIENRVLESVSSAEKANYQKLSADAKKDFLISRLNEDIFTPLDIKPADWDKFFNGWVNRVKNQEDLIIHPFKLTKGTVIDEKLEKDFVEYLSHYNVVEKKSKVVAGEVRETIEVVCRYDERYKKNKIAFIKDKVDIFETLNNANATDIGNFGLNLKEYAAFLVALIESKPPENNWLSSELHEQLVNLVKDLIQADIEKDAGAKAKDDVSVRNKVKKAQNGINTGLTPIELLNEIINFKATVYTAAKRVKLFENIETEFIKIVGSNYFKNFKKNYLIKNHKEKFNANSAGIGNFGLNLKEYAAFLVALIESKTPENNWLSSELHEQLVNLVKDLIKADIEKDTGAKAKDDVSVREEVEKAQNYINTELTPIELLNEIIDFKATVGTTANRVKLFENIETEFIKIVGSKYFKNFKADYLIKNCEKKFNAAFKDNFLGTCGMKVNEFQNFLTEQINSNQPLPYVAQNNLPVYKIKENIVAYLKQIPCPNQDSHTFGHVFDRAFKDAKEHYLYLDHTLMKIADDLANAKFDINGGTKKALYLFAFAFDMGFNTGTNAVSKERDIEKNLFQDFYTANFLRYEDPPTGEGINFKNVVEVIYLYFLNKTGLTPAQKLNAAEQFIQNVFTAARQKPVTFDELPMSSSVYRQNFLDSALNMSEPDFMQYLLDNYKIYSNKRSESNNRIMMASEMRTVKRNFQKLVDKINSYPAFTYPAYKKKRKVKPLEIDIEISVSGLSIENLVDTLTAFNVNLHDTELEKILADADFIAVLKKMETTLDVNKRILKNEKFFDAKRYTRSDLIALYYYYFSNFVVNTLIADYNVTDWKELAEEFLYCFVDENSVVQPGLNIYLDECGFARFSSKILYDFFIIFFLYLEIVW